MFCFQWTFSSVFVSSGESGSGKTENKKLILQYFASISTSKTKHNCEKVYTISLLLNNLLKSHIVPQTISKPKSSFPKTWNLDWPSISKCLFHVYIEPKIIVISYCVQHNYYQTNFLISMQILSYIERFDL